MQKMVQVLHAVLLSSLAVSQGVSSKRRRPQKVSVVEVDASEGDLSSQVLPISLPNSEQVRWEPISMNRTRFAEIDQHYDSLAAGELDSNVDDDNFRNSVEFHWNTAIVSATEDGAISPWIVRLHDSGKFDSMVALLNEQRTKMNADDLSASMLDIDLDSDNDDDKLSELLDSDSLKMTQSRMTQWLKFYLRQSKLNDRSTFSSRISLLFAPKGSVIPLQTLSDLMGVIGADTHGLTGIISLHTQNSDPNDGWHVYDPRGTVAGYGIANTFLEFNPRIPLFNSLNVIPTSLSVSLLSVSEYDRIYLLFHTDQLGRLSSLSTNNPLINGLKTIRDVVGLSSIIDSSMEIRSQTRRKLEKPYFDQNINIFNGFGTPISRSSIPGLMKNHTDDIAQCLIDIAKLSQSVRKSNRGGFQSRASLFGFVKLAREFYQLSHKMKIGNNSVIQNDVQSSMMESRMGNIIFQMNKDFRFINNDENELSISESCVNQMSLMENSIYKEIGWYLKNLANHPYFDDNGILTVLKKSVGVRIDIVDSWFNVNRGNNQNVAHSHPDSDLSAVVYLSIPESMTHGTIEFSDPRINGKLIDTGDVSLDFGQFGESVLIQPKIGDFLVFPAWLHHWANPISSNAEDISDGFSDLFKQDPKSLRISVALNIKLSYDLDGYKADSEHFDAGGYVFYRKSD